MKIKYLFFGIVGALYLLAGIPVSAAGKTDASISVGKAVSCQWYFNNTILPGETDPTIRPAETGNYTAVYVTPEGKVMRQTTYFNAATGTKVKLYVIGDSTASYYDPTRFPRTGWAQIFQAFFNPDSVEVVDKALSGRSSKSFYTDASGWPVVKPLLKEGDYLFIQFGHNDEKEDRPELYTEPYTTFKEYLKKYIDEARAAGAIPVLLTPIHRNGWSGTSIKDSHGDYPPAMRELAAEENVPLIDLTEKTAWFFESYGQDLVTNEFFMNLPDSTYRYYPDGNTDNTHLQIRGAYEVSKLVQRAIGQQRSEEGLDKLYRGSLPAGFIKILVKAFNMGSVNGDQIVPLDSLTTLDGIASRGYLFDHFELNGSEIYNETPIDVLIADSLQSLTAYFVKSYLVKISVDPSGKADFSGNGYYGEGDSVTVVAIPDPGYRFLNWTLNDTVVSTDSIYTFVMDATITQLVIHLEQTSSIVPSITETVKLTYEPGSGHLMVYSQSEIEEVWIYDLGGKLFRKETINSRATAIDLTGMADEVYIIRIKTGEGIISEKFLKNGR